MMSRLGRLLIAVSAALSTASGAALSRRATGDTFALFGYGSNDASIGGYPIISIDGLAYIANSPNVTLGNSPGVSVSFVDTGSVWLASSNNTSGNQTSFTNATFYVPSATSTSTQAGFLAANETATDDIITSTFTFYGHVAILETSSGAWETLFYALPTDIDGIWSVNWNGTDVSDAIPLTIKDTQPPNVDFSKLSR